MILVDISQFEAYQEGILLDFKMGVGIVVNEVACEKAQKALTDGEEVGFTIDNKLVYIGKTIKSDPYSIKLVKFDKKKKRGR